MSDDLWYNICEMTDSKKINYNEFSAIEKAIIKSEYDIVIDLLKSGETNYYDGVLCNGYYQKNNSIHPKTCFSMVCCRTLLYYALWSNCYCYSKIFSIIVQILDSVDNLGFLSLHSTNDNRDTITKNTVFHIKNVYNLLIDVDCACHITNRYQKFYDHTTTNFNHIYRVLIANIPQVLDYLEGLYGAEEQHDCPDEYCIVCHKRKLGRQYTFTNSETVNTNQYSGMGKIVGMLKYIWKKYMINTEIVRILFNQQAYEYYKYNLLNKSYQLESILESIVCNPWIDINYVSSFGDNIFSITILNQQNKGDLFDKIKKLGGKLPDSVTVHDVLKNYSVSNATELIKHATMNYLGDIEIFISMILQYDQMMSSDKIDIVENLIQRSFCNSCENLIQICLKDELSYSLLQKIAEKKNLIEKATPYEINICIKLLKHRELNILLVHNPNLINAEFENFPPIIHFFNETNCDGVEEKMLIKTLLSHKPNLNVFNTLHENPLLKAVKMNRNYSFDLLISDNSLSKYDDYDAGGLNAFHYAIMGNNIHIINKLKKHLINSLTTTKLHPLVLAVDSSNPRVITKILLDEDSLDCEYKLPDGDNVLHYLLKAKLSPKTKNELFKKFLTRNFDLLEQSKNGMKPLVVKAVERDLYSIVIMIMNKLLENGEIRFEGYDNLRDINKIVDDNKTRNIIVKDITSPNFYSLVIMYLKNGKSAYVYDGDDNDTSMVNFNENLFFMFTITSIVVFYDMCSDECLEYSIF